MPRAMLTRREGSARAVSICALGAVLLLGANAWAQAENHRALILTRAFAYDYTLKERAGSSLVLAVLYKPGTPSSEACANSWIQAFQPLQSLKVQGLPLVAVKLPYGPNALQAFEGQGVDVLLSCPGLEGESAAIRDLARARKLLTIGAAEEDVQNGMAIGVFSDGATHKMVVNLKAAAEEGISFSSDLLRLAKVIR